MALSISTGGADVHTCTNLSANPATLLRSDRQGVTAATVAPGITAVAPRRCRLKAWRETITPATAEDPPHPLISPSRPGLGYHPPATLRPPSRWEEEDGGSFLLVLRNRARRRRFRTQVFRLDRVPAG